MSQEMMKRFLKSYSDTDKYDFFMESTMLYQIGDNYKNALIDLEKCEDKLKDTKDELEEKKKEIDALKVKIGVQESLGEERKKLVTLRREFLWSLVKFNIIFKINPQKTKDYFTRRSPIEKKANPFKSFS